MSTLFSPIELRSLTLRNRIVISPMCQYSAVGGTAQDWHMIHLGQLALSGAGLLTIEATHVSAPGRITPSCLGLYSDQNEAALARILNALREHSNIPVAMQVAHAGRKASSEELRAIVGEFADTARRAERLGIDALELHSAHGYLLHSFLSPISNQRTDEYGGSLENRMRLPLEVFDTVREVWPKHKPLGLRLSTTDWVEGGWDVEQSIALAKLLHARGCDWLDCSSGGVAPARQKITLGPGYQVPNAVAIRKAVPGLKTMAVGLITDPHQAEKIIADDQADMVALARAMLYNPRWPWHAAAALGASVDAPKQYWRSAPREAPQVLGNKKVGTR